MTGEYVHKLTTSTMIRVFCILAMLWGPPIAVATETDQYLSLGKPLTDSADRLSQFINQRVAERLGQVNERPGGQGLTCRSLTREIMWGFRMLFIHTIEVWVLDSELDIYPPRDVSASEYRAQSIYDKGDVIDLQKLLPLARSMRVDGVVFGLDKLGHFVSLGHKYFNRYLDLLGEGVPDSRARQLVVESGFDEEVGMIGEAVSGVVSYADLEANYQGFLFTRSLCQTEDPRVIQEQGEWKLIRPVDIRDYVNPYWDESFNNSVYSDSKWALVSGNLEPYCDSLDAGGSLGHEYDQDSLIPSTNMEMVLAAEESGIIRRRADYSLAKACIQGRD